MQPQILNNPSFGFLVSPEGKGRAIVGSSAIPRRRAQDQEANARQPRPQDKLD